MSHVSSYSQIVARSGAERGYLLSKEKLQSLAETKNLRELTANLKGSPYESMLKVLPEPSLVPVQRAFMEELIRLYTKIVRFSPRELQAFLREYISRLEIENLQVLLRAKNAHLSYESIVAMLHFSIEDIFGRRELFIEAAKLEDIRAVIKPFQNTPYAQALSEAFSQFEETKSPRPFDLALDRGYYEHLLNSAKTLSKKHQRIITQVLGPQLDMFNIETIIRGKFLSYQPQWIDQAVTSRLYKLSPDDMHALNLIESPASALTVVKQTPYQKFLTPHETIEETLTDFEKAVRIQGLKQLDETRIRDPFNISTPLSIIMSKEAEVENLTKISTGIDHGWKPEETTSTLL